jgi:hypothetical protein
MKRKLLTKAPPSLSSIQWLGALSLFKCFFKPRACKKPQGCIKLQVIRFPGGGHLVPLLGFLKVAMSIEFLATSKEALVKTKNRKTACS